MRAITKNSRYFDSRFESRVLPSEFWSALTRCCSDVFEDDVTGATLSATSVPVLRPRQGACLRE